MPLHSVPMLIQFSVTGNAYTICLPLNIEFLALFVMFYLYCFSNFSCLIGQMTHFGHSINICWMNVWINSFLILKEFMCVCVCVCAHAFIQVQCYPAFFSLLSRLPVHLLSGLDSTWLFWAKRNKNFRLPEERDHSFLFLL